MNRTMTAAFRSRSRHALAAALAATLVPAVAHGGLCDAAKLKAASSFAACRGKADGLWLKTGDAAKRDALYAKCDDALVKGYAAAELRYGATCPTVGDVGAVKKYLTQCTDDTYDSTQPGGTVPDYVADLAACSGDLAAAVGGTATAADVLSGKTFTSAAGIGATGAMPNNGAVTITPGATPQAIAAGYHSGSGTVAGDANLVAGNVAAGRSIFGVSGTAAPLTKTGQTTSYGGTSDGYLQRGASRSFTDNGDGTVTDDRTGLVWEKKSDDGSIHDKDNTYTWWSGLDLIIPYAMNGTMVNGFLSTLNTAPCFAGHCDWRIPNNTELLSLVNYETFDPATFTAFNTACTAGCSVTTCSCTASTVYWSSTTMKATPNRAWEVYFLYGTDFNDSKTFGYAVRAVRGGF